MVGLVKSISSADLVSAISSSLSLQIQGTTSGKVRGIRLEYLKESNVSGVKERKRWQKPGHGRTYRSGQFFFF